MNERRERWERVRNICLVQALAKLGHIPTKTTEKEAWFLSPLRSETHASFHVHLNKNVWYDFGLGEGGSIIDLVMALNNCSAREALNFLEQDFIKCLRAPQLKKREKEPDKVRIKMVKNIIHPALRQYLQFRKIPLKVAGSYCKEVHYTFKGRPYFSLGMRNITGGWELRNQLFKNSTSGKNYSLFRKNSSILIITEGMFDLLSLAVLKKRLVTISDCLVLNSLSFLDRIKDEVVHYDQVLLFLDRDPAGKKATDNLLKSYAHVEDRSSLYRDFKDCNEYLINSGVKVFQDVSLS